MRQESMLVWPCEHCSPDGLHRTNFWCYGDATGRARPGIKMSHYNWPKRSSQHWTVEGLPGAPSAEGILRLSTGLQEWEDPGDIWPDAHKWNHVWPLPKKALRSRSQSSSVFLQFLIPEKKHMLESVLNVPEMTVYTPAKDRCLHPYMLLGNLGGNIGYSVSIQYLFTYILFTYIIYNVSIKRRKHPFTCFMYSVFITKRKHLSII